MNDIHNDLVQLRQLVLKRKNDIIKEFLANSLNVNYYIHKTIIEKENAYETYYNRSRVQEEVTKKKVVTGYEDLLNDLLKVELEKILIVTISLENATYIIFSSIDYELFIGILKSTNSNLSKLKEIDKVNESRFGGKYKLTGTFNPPLNELESS